MMIARRLSAQSAPNNAQATLLLQGAQRFWFGHLATNQHVDTLAEHIYQTFNHFARKKFLARSFFLATL